MFARVSCINWFCHLSVLAKRSLMCRTLFVLAVCRFYLNVRSCVEHYSVCRVSVIAKCSLVCRALFGFAESVFAKRSLVCRALFGFAESVFAKRSLVCRALFGFAMYSIVQKQSVVSLTQCPKFALDRHNNSSHDLFDLPVT